MNAKGIVKLGAFSYENQNHCLENIQFGLEDQLCLLFPYYEFSKELVLKI